MMNEDSLRLNIWTPRPPTRASRSSCSSTVAASPRATPTLRVLAATDCPERVVFVDLAYRSGPFGFMNVGDVPGAPNEVQGQRQPRPARSAPGAQVRPRQHRQVRWRSQSCDTRGQVGRCLEHDASTWPAAKQQALPAGHRRLRIAAGRHQAWSQEGLPR